MSLRIFFYTAVEGELVSLSRAARQVRQEYGELVEVVARSRRVGLGEEEVARLAVAAHLIVVHLMGGPDSLPGLEEIVETARKKDIPLAVLPSLGEEGGCGNLCVCHVPKGIVAGQPGNIAGGCRADGGNRRGRPGGRG